MQVQTPKHHYTPEEYLALEDAAEYKNEYRDGEILPMTGGTTNHNKIALNMAANLKFALRGQTYDIYIGDVRLWIPRYRQLFFLIPSFSDGTRNEKIVGSASKLSFPGTRRLLTPVSLLPTPDSCSLKGALPLPEGTSSTDHQYTEGCRRLGDGGGTEVRNCHSCSSVQVVYCLHPKTKYISRSNRRREVPRTSI